MKALLPLLALILLTADPRASVIYDNTSNFEGTEPVTAIEVGDEIGFAGTERKVTDFAAEYYAKALGAGAVTMRLRIYLNDGPVDASSSRPTPGTLIYDSQPVMIFEGFHAVQISGMNVVVAAESMTWTVEFSGIPPGGEAGLMRYGAPSVGTSGDFIWEKDESGTWRAVTRTGKSNNFSARVLATKAPDANTVLEQEIALSGRFNLVGIEVMSGSNTLAELFPDAPVGMVLYKFNNARGYEAFQKYETRWSRSETKILPGEGFVAVMPPMPDNANATVTYRTTIRGTAPLSLPPLFTGWNLVSAGSLQRSVGQPFLEARPGDTAFAFSKNSSSYTVNSFEPVAGTWDPPLRSARGDGIWYFAGAGWPTNSNGAVSSDRMTPIYVSNLSPAYGINERLVSNKGVPLTGNAVLYATSPNGVRLAVGAPIPLGTGEFAGYFDPAAELIRYLDHTVPPGMAELTVVVEGVEGSGRTTPVQVMHQSMNPPLPPISLAGIQFIPNGLPEFLVQPLDAIYALGGAAVLRAVFNYAQAEVPDGSLTFDQNCGSTNGCPVRYQWQKMAGAEWINVEGATADSLRFEALHGDDLGLYRLIAFFGKFQAMSAAITLSSPVSVKIRNWTSTGTSVRLGLDTSVGTENFYVLEISTDLKTWKPISCPVPVDRAGTSFTTFEKPDGSKILFFRARAANTADGLGVLDCGFSR